VPLPNNEYLNVSTTGVSGFQAIKERYDLFARKDIGYAMGVAYISNWTAKLISRDRSRYLVVKEEMIMPDPSPRPGHH
jgi:hypothetical protein